MHDALIFDCDGTLTNSMPVHFLAWRETMDRHGIELSEQRFYGLAGVPTDKIIELLASEQGLELDARQIAQEKEDAFLRVVHLVQLIPSVSEIARQHRGRKKMAVASGGWRQVVQSQLRHLGIESWFDAIVTAEDTQRHKPEPDVFLEAARRLQVAPSACLVYEDSDLGIEAARRAGMEWVDVRKM